MTAGTLEEDDLIAIIRPATDARTELPEVLTITYADLFEQIRSEIMDKIHRDYYLNPKS